MLVKFANIKRKTFFLVRKFLRPLIVVKIVLNTPWGRWFGKIFTEFIFNIYLSYTYHVPDIYLTSTCQNNMEVYEVSMRFSWGFYEVWGLNLMSLPLDNHRFSALVYEDVRSFCIVNDFQGYDNRCKRKAVLLAAKGRVAMRETSYCFLGYNFCNLGSLHVLPPGVCMCRL
jgi:hypothetical protein